MYRPIPVQLNEWELEKYAKSFEENAVDEENFVLLDTCKDSLKELIPPVGPRMKFLAELKKFKDGLLETTQHVQQSNCSELDSSSESSIDLPTTSDNTGISPKRCRMDFDIKQILEKQKGGEAIVDEMTKGLLSHKARVQAVRVLVSHLFENYGERPNTAIKTAMALAIIQQFPLLKDDDGVGYEAWYTPAMGKHGATGCLEERLRNVRKRMKDRGQKGPINNSSPSSASNSSLQSTVNLIFTTDEVTSDEDEKMTTWLKHNTEPRSQVVQYMAKTSKSRAVYIRDHSEATVDDIIGLYPRLMDIQGMIEQDFRLMLPSAADKLFHSWDSLYEGILQYADTQNNWRLYLRVESPTSDDARKNLAIMVLPCILPAGVQSVQGKNSRCSIEDAMRSFVDCQPIGTNIPTFLEKKMQKQPFILLLGDPLKPEQVFVVVEQKVIEQRSLMKALDVCFKLFYVLDLSYPWQSLSTWEFFQKAVYGLGKGKGKETTSCAIRSLRAFLNNQAKN